jgi:hypothetical protein
VSDVRVILGGITGLFVDDGSLAAAIIVWNSCCIAAHKLFDIAPIWSGAGFCIGLAAILIENVRRSARNLRRPAQKGARPRI